MGKRRKLREWLRGREVRSRRVQHGQWMPSGLHWKLATSEWLRFQPFGL